MLKGTRDANGMMTVIGEINIEHGKDVYAYFVNYEKAFDILEWPKLFKALKKCYLPDSQKRAIIPFQFQPYLKDLSHISEQASV